MDDNYRFNRDEIGKILKRAAELEHEDSADNDDDHGIGLTLQELREISGEVGIDPKYVQQALEELDDPSTPAGSTLFGGPFSFNIFDSAEQPMEEEAWEEVVSEIRRIHGGIGKTGRLGNTFEWEQRKREVGYIQISLSPKEDHTRIHINGSYRYYAVVVYMMAGIFGLTFLGILFDDINMTVFTQIITTASVVLGLFAGVRFYLSNWMKKKRATYGKLISRFKEMLGSGGDKDTVPAPEKSSASAVDIPETDHDSESRDEAGPAFRKSKTR